MNELLNEWNEWMKMNSSIHSYFIKQIKLAFANVTDQISRKFN